MNPQAFPILGFFPCTHFASTPFVKMPLDCGMEYDKQQQTGQSRQEWPGNREIAHRGCNISALDSTAKCLLAGETRSGPKRSVEALLEGRLSF